MECWLEYITMFLDLAWLSDKLKKMQNTRLDIGVIKVEIHGNVNYIVKCLVGVIMVRNGKMGSSLVSKYLLYSFRYLNSGKVKN